MNSVHLIGNIANDPTSRKVGDENQVVNFRLAVDGAGAKKDDTGYFDVSCWNGQGEAVMGYCAKGSRVAVEGNLRSRTWEAQDGSKRYAVEIGNSRVTFLTLKSPDEATNSEPAETPPASDEIPF